MPFLVRAASLTGFVEVAREAGLNPARLMSEVGFSPRVLREPELRIPAGRAAMLLEIAAAASGLEGFGVRMAETRQLSNFGAVGLLIRDQPTLRDSLRVLMRYQAMLSGSLSLTMEETAHTAIVREEFMVGDDQPVRQAVELGLGVMLRTMRQVLGPGWRPRLVCFTHAAPRDAQVHLRLFGPDIKFGRNFNGIVLSRSDLEARNPAADPAMALHAKRLLDASATANDATLLDELRHSVLLLLPSGRCGIEQVSAHLGLVSRTVQRRLAEQGLTYSGLIDELRRELASRHVKGGQRPLAEVAALLGFAAPSGFSRWYRAQFGCSPQASRGPAPAPRQGVKPGKA